MPVSDPVSPLPRRQCQNHNGPAACVTDCARTLDLATGTGSLRGAPVAARNRDSAGSRPKIEPARTPLFPLKTLDKCTQDEISQWNARLVTSIRHY